MNYEFADKLIELRKAAGLSQEDLAAKLGVSRQAVSKWERAEASPDTDNIIALAKLYNVTVDELLNVNADAPSHDSASAGHAKKKVHINIPGFVNINVNDGDHCDGDEEWFAKNSEVTWDSDGTRVINKKHKKNPWYSFPYPILATVAYLLMGFVWGLWHPGWIIFLTIPLYYWIVQAIDKRSFPTLSAGGVVTLVYLVLGFGFQMWHPWWLLFLAIPIFDFFIKLIRRKDKDCYAVNIDDDDDDDDDDD